MCLCFLIHRLASFFLTVCLHEPDENRSTLYSAHLRLVPGVPGDAADDWARKGVTWGAMEAMKPCFVGGLSSRCVVGETGPAFAVKDALLLDAKLVPLYRCPPPTHTPLAWRGRSSPLARARVMIGATCSLAVTNVLAQIHGCLRGRAGAEPHCLGQPFPAVSHVKCDAVWLILLFPIAVWQFPLGRRASDQGRIMSRVGAVRSTKRNYANCFVI